MCQFTITGYAETGQTIHNNTISSNRSMHDSKAAGTSDQKWNSLLTGRKLDRLLPDLKTRQISPWPKTWQVSRWPKPWHISQWSKTWQHSPWPKTWQVSHWPKTWQLSHLPQTWQACEGAKAETDGKKQTEFMTFGDWVHDIWGLASFADEIAWWP